MADLAERQHGVATRKQLLALGLSRHAIDSRISRGLLNVVYPGVLAIWRRSPSPACLWMAGVLACGSGAVLSHRSAARLWGVFPYDPRRVEVSRPRAGRTKHRGILLRQARLLPDEVTEVDGIPVTSIFRTIFDLAAVCSKREVERAFHETDVRQLTDRVSLPQLLERHPGRRGAATIRAVLAGRESVGVTRNELEERFVALLDSHRLPRPRLNGTLAVRGRLLEPDCMWQRERLIVELDGREVHGTDKAFESDRQRDRILLAEGWRSTRVTWRQLRGEPEAVAADLRAALYP